MNNTSWLQQRLEKIWYHNGRGRFLLLPLSALYCAINNYQRKKYTQNRPQLACPVIVVGNITVGGTGKTPLTIHIVKLLQAAGYKPAIITRGYGGAATVWPQSVTPNTKPTLAGDEAVLMAIRTYVPVYAGADRLLSIKKIMQDEDVNVIVADDGMQHYKLPRDIQIAVVDASRMLGNGYCLPAGPLREKKERLNNCDLIVSNGAAEGFSESQWYKMQLEGEVLTNLKTAQQKELNAFKSNRVNAVTGIGNPQRFFNKLQQAGLQLNSHSFPDHYKFDKADLDFNDDLAIIMSEKDAVKCSEFATENIWYLPVSAKLDPSFDKTLLALLTNKIQEKRAN